ncbi:hypothetical protein T492DRAFT_976805 [Pavlovales sp. CCMP2436]|nr:hypothetical protein T492DRAFT_976805 [Pavlovales sp. CCMP2436]
MMLGILQEGEGKGGRKHSLNASLLLILYSMYPFLYQPRWPQRGGRGEGRENTFSLHPFYLSLLLV